MRREFRAALGNWRGDSVIDERDEFPNEDEGCGVITNTSQSVSFNNAQIGTDDKNKPQMVTTTVQHMGGEVQDITSIAEENYGPIEPHKIKAKEFKMPKKVSCYN